MTPPAATPTEMQAALVGMKEAHLRMAAVVSQIIEEYPEEVTFLMAIGLGLAVGYEHRCGARTCSVEEDLEILLEQVRESARCIYNPS